jgi:hypothetical protein
VFSGPLGPRAFTGQFAARRGFALPLADPQSPKGEDSQRYGDQIECEEHVFLVLADYSCGEIRQFVTD